MAAGAPVDQAVIAVDQAIFVKLNKNGPHRFREPFVHRKALTLPVARCAKAFQLADNLPAGLRLPFPDPLDKGFTPKIMTVLPFGAQLPLDHVLCGNAGMVGARHPEDIIPLHPFPAAEDVLQGVVEGMPHMQGAGYVGRRNDN